MGAHPLLFLDPKMFIPSSFSKQFIQMMQKQLHSCILCKQEPATVSSGQLSLYTGLSRKDINIVQLLHGTVCPLSMRPTISNNDSYSCLACTLGITGLVLKKLLGTRSLRASETFGDDLT